MSRLGPREPVGLRLAGTVSLDDLLWVANTAHGPGAHWHARPSPGDPDHDHLRDPADARRYLADHRVAVPATPPDEAALAGLRTIRSVVRDGLLAGADPWTPDARTLLGASAFRLGPDAMLEPVDDGWTGLVAALGAACVSLGASASLRECANPACRLVFLDGTRNGSRAWCDPGGCGNRVRVRRARRRGRASGDEPAVSRPGTPS